MVVELHEQPVMNEVGAEAEAGDGAPEWQGEERVEGGPVPGAIARGQGAEKEDSAGS